MGANPHYDANLGWPAIVGNNGVLLNRDDDEVSISVRDGIVRLDVSDAFEVFLAFAAILHIDWRNRLADEIAITQGYDGEVIFGGVR